MDDFSCWRAEIGVIDAGAIWQLTVDKGPEDGVAVGDKVRVQCGEGTVIEAYGRRAVIEAVAGPRPKPLRVRIGRNGATPPAWCPPDKSGIDHP